MDEDRELGAVTGTSGAETGSAKQRNNRNGKTSDHYDYDQSPCRPVILSSPPVILSSPGEDAGYTGRIMNEPASKSRRRVFGGQARNE